MLRVGFIGTSWMARVHAHALHTIQHVAARQEPIELAAIASSQQPRAQRAARQLGFSRATDDWREVVEDPAIDVIVNLTSNDLHAEPSIRALETGKAVLCEKPLGRSSSEVQAMVDAAKRASRPAACGFNYRFVPAIRLARQLLDEGRLGQVRHVRAAYLQDWAASAEIPRNWRFEQRRAGSGVVGDYSHLIDLVRYLAGEPTSVVAETVTVVEERPDPGGEKLLPVETEDAYAAVLRLESGSLATLQASRCATGRKGHQFLEVSGSAGALWWDMEDLNRLHAYVDDGELGGFRDVLVTEPGHPFQEYWWSPGHILGWEHTFAHQWLAFLELLSEPSSESHIATFEDGARAVHITEAILTSSVLIEDGTIVSTEGRTQGKTVYEAVGDALPAVPTVVLINGDTASAAEILTAALSQAGLATVVGETTFGKGSFQQVIPLDSGGALDLTVGEYLTRDGSSLNNKGFKPDVWAPDRPKTKADETLDRARSVLAVKLQG